jgi:hypothetical protein
MNRLPWDDAGTGTNQSTKQNKTKQNKTKHSIECLFHLIFDIDNSDFNFSLNCLKVY